MTLSKADFMYPKKRNQIFALMAVLTSTTVLTACKEEAKPIPEPKNPKPAAVVAEFADWEFLMPSLSIGQSPKYFKEKDKNAVTLAFDSPKPLYSGTPTTAQRETLLVELAALCKSQFATDYFAWIENRFPNDIIAYVEMIVRHDEDPENSQWRYEQNFNARFEYVDGKCGDHFSIGQKLIPGSQSQTTFIE